MMTGSLGKSNIKTRIFTIKLESRRTLENCEEKKKRRMIRGISYRYWEFSRLDSLSPHMTLILVNALYFRKRKGTHRRKVEKIQQAR